MRTVCCAIRRGLPLLTARLATSLLAPFLTSLSNPSTQLYSLSQRLLILVNVIIIIINIIIIIISSSSHIFALVLTRHQLDPVDQLCRG
jgi:hypothetical protein